MSGRGEPRGGAGVAGGDSPHPTAGTRERPAGPGGQRLETRELTGAVHPPAVCRSSNALLRQVLNWGGGCSGMPPALLWSCREAPLPPTSAYLLSILPSWLRRWDAPLHWTQRWHPGIPSFVGGDSPRVDTGKRQSICLHAVSPTHASYRVLVHGGRVWAISSPLRLRVPFPAGLGATPIKPSYLQGPAWWGEAALLQECAGLRCSALRSRWSFVSQSVLVTLLLLGGGCVCCGSSALPLWGAVDLAVRALPRWGKSRWVDLGGTIPSPEPGGSSPVHRVPAWQWVWADGQCQSGSWCYRTGDVLAGVGVSLLTCRKSTVPGLQEPEDGATLRIPTATHDCGAAPGR